MRHITILTLLFLVVLFGCMTPKQTAASKENGLYNLVGWNGAYVGNGSGTAIAIDIDGKVGYELNVSSPTARCVPITSVGWSANHGIVSGTLPPGLSFVQGTSSIRGIPTKRGHFIVKLSFRNVSCNGKSYMGFEQELRFHIGGSGIVNE